MSPSRATIRWQQLPPVVLVPSRRLYMLLGGWLAIAPLLALATDLPTAAGMTLLYDLLVLAIAMLDAARVSPVDVRRDLPERLSVGRENPVVLHVAPPEQAAIVLLRDGYPSEFAVSSAEFRVAIAAGHGQDLLYAARPSRRGEFAWGALSLRQLGPWGLAWRGCTRAGTATARVYPNLLALRELSIRLALEGTGTLRRRRLGAGTEFAELRDYRQGDDLRQLDWKATARRSTPIVRVLEPEREQTLVILLDAGRSMTARVQGLQRFDWAVNAALSLSTAAIQRGDRVGLSLFAGEVRQWLAPERGQPHLAALIERLASVQPILAEPDYAGAVSHLVRQQMRRALVVFLTDIVDELASEELLGAMLRLRPRYLPFCVALRDPEVDRLARPASDTVAAGYERAVALDLLAQREAVMAHLKQRGVLVLDAPANGISDRLVERYLQVKAKNLL